MEFLISITGSEFHNLSNVYSLDSIEFGNQDGQHRKNLLLCISNESNGTEHK